MRGWQCKILEILRETSLFDVFIYPFILYFIWAVLIGKFLFTRKTCLLFIAPARLRKSEFPAWPVLNVIVDGTYRSWWSGALLNEQRAAHPLYLWWRHSWLRLPPINKQAGLSSQCRKNHSGILQLRVPIWYPHFFSSIWTIQKYVAIIANCEKDRINDFKIQLYFNINTS